MDSAESRLAALELKFRMLEVHHRQLKSIIALIAVGFAAVLVVAAAAPRTITAGKLVLTDGDGHARVRLDATGLTFLAASGNRLANFWADPKVGAGLVFFDGSRKNGRLGIGMWGKYPGLGIDDTQGHERAWFGEESYGSAIELFDIKAKKRLTAEAKVDEPFLSVLDSAERTRVGVYVTVGDSGVVLTDARGTSRARMYFSDKPALQLYGSSGQTVWSAP
jgi:hypothetical protein